MKKFAVIAGALALAACGGGNDAAEGDAAPVDTAAVATTDVANAGGTYTGTAEDGATWTAELNADGTYKFTQGGETTQFGKWEDNIRGTCLTEDTGDAAAPASEMCYAFGVPAADGAVTVTGPDGESFTMTKQM